MYVRPSVCPVHCGKTVDWIRMPFGIIGRTGPWMRQVVCFMDRSTGRGRLIFEGEFGARHCNQWGLYGVPVGYDSAATRPSSQLLWADLLLGGVALRSQRHIVIKLSHGRSVGASVCPVHCGKTADWIRMPFSVIGRTCPGIRQVLGFGYWSTGRGTFGGEFGARHLPHIGRPRAISIPNFDQIPQSAAEILLLPVSENKRPPSWNSTSGFDFDPFTAIGMWFSIRIPNIIKIGLSVAELWRHSNFQDGGRQPCWIWFTAMVAHPRSASGGFCFILKLWLDRINSFGDRAVFIFWHFGLKLPIRAHFFFGGGRGFGSIFSPNDVIYHCNSKRH